MHLHPTIERYFRTVIDHRGTDLLLSTGSAPLVRVDGALILDTDLDPVDDDMMEHVLAALLSADQRAALEVDRDVDFAFSYGASRFRGNAFYQRGKAVVALRLMSDAVPSFDEIRL